MDFGRMLKILRLSAGIGLREFSKIIDVSPTYLSLVENGKQAPPNAARIAQIECALKVPVGCLSSLTSDLGTDTTTYVGQVPESVDFLEVAKRNAMTSADFMKLTGFLNVYGWDMLERTIEDVRGEEKNRCIEAEKCNTDGPCVWPFLRERLIFDLAEAKDKERFLKDTIERIADRLEIFDRSALTRALLERETITSTGIGGGVAVPHAYLPELKEMIVAIVRVPNGLDFNAIDGLPVYMAIMLAGPPSAENLHLRLLARIAKLVSHSNFCNGLMAASGPQEIISMFKGAEFGIP